jgi:hypothetical protein
VAYEDLFGVWKNADPDIPILHQAKAEQPGCNDGQDLMSNTTCCGSLNAVLE